MPRGRLDWIWRLLRVPHPTELTLRAGREVLLQGSPLPPPCSAKPLPTSGALRAASPICTRLLRKSMTYSAGGASCRFTRSSWRWWEMKTRPGAETRSSCTRSRLMFRFLEKKMSAQWVEVGATPLGDRTGSSATNIKQMSSRRDARVDNHTASESSAPKWATFGLGYTRTANASRKWFSTPIWAKILVWRRTTVV